MDTSMLRYPKYCHLVEVLISAAVSLPYTLLHHMHACAHSIASSLIKVKNMYFPGYFSFLENNSYKKKRSNWRESTSVTGIMISITGFVGLWTHIHIVFPIQVKPVVWSCTQWCDLAKWINSKTKFCRKPLLSSSWAQETAGLSSWKINTTVIFHHYI